MKNLLIIMIITLAACTSQVKTDEKDSKIGKEQGSADTAILLNNGKKWKADETTKKNAGDMIRLVNDGVYRKEANKDQLVNALRKNIDTLVQQCTMQGAAHEALHAWLETVLKDMKELKEEDDDYALAFSTLKKDVEVFSLLFE